MNIQRFFLLASFIFTASILSGCGGGSSSPATSTTPAAASITYSTTSNKGDYAEWTLSGNSLNATWEVIDGSGNINYTYTIAANCSAADADGVHLCTISTASCKDGLSSCPTTPPTSAFAMIEVPGVALLVHTTASNGGDELQVGFVKNTNACNDDVSGDYTFIRTGIGLRDSFGIYRSDKNLVNIADATFGFDTTATTRSGYNSQSLTYLTNSATAALGDKGCTNGVRIRTMGGDTYRSMMTASGLFVLDLPAKQGGMLSFNIKKAASLADFANKSFYGIDFPDDGGPQTFHASFGAVTNNKVDFSISLLLPQVIGKGGLNIMALSTPATLTSPAYPDFTTPPANYSSSPLQTDYHAPNVIPGLFKMGKFLDKGRVILAAMKFNNKVIAIGMSNNYRSTHDTNPSTGNAFAGPGVYNSGNFILFEK